jgi:integrase
MTNVTTNLLILEDAKIPINHRTVQSRLGTRIKLATENSFLPKAIILDTNSSKSIIHPQLWFTGDEEIDRVMRPFLISVIERYMPKTVTLYEKFISLFIDIYRDCQDINDALSEVVLESSRKGIADIAPIRNLIRWFIAYEVEGLSLDLSEEILDLVYGGNQNAYLALYSLDAENGPFVREELRILQAAALNPELHIEDRVVLKLCLEFGLRPIQIVLLKQSDFIVDNTLSLAYIRIPRVKQRNQHRRTEFTDRLVSNELAKMIQQLIDVHREIYSQPAAMFEYDLNTAPLIMRRHSFWHPDNPNHPYILSSNSSNTQRKIIANSHKDFIAYIAVGWEDVTHHILSQGVDYRLDCIAEKLPLSPRTGRPFKMNAYRFRYTLGTTAVTNGLTEIEVANLLDHSVTGSVKHYFHYTHEMFEVLEDATLDRVENKFFTAAWAKETMKGNIYDIDVVEPNTAITIGKCQKGSPCALEPAVACYQCDKFHPNKDTTGHKKALTSLKKRAEQAAQVSNRSVAHQFDEAIAGCTAAVAYSEGEQVFSIQDESDRIALAQIGPYTNE